jgi:hypothetical protein
LDGCQQTFLWYGVFPLALIALSFTRSLEIRILALSIGSDAEPSGTYLLIALKGNVVAMDYRKNLFLIATVDNLYKHTISSKKITAQKEIRASSQTTSIHALPLN